MFPVELVDIIIGHLHDDHPSLKACAQASHTWLISSRFHLFQYLEIRLSPSREQEEMECALRCFETNVGQLCRPFVRRLTVRPASFDAYGTTDEPSVELHTLGRLLDALPRLQALMLTAVTWPGFLEDRPPPLTSASVTSLVVTKPAHLGGPASSRKQQFIQDGFDIFHLLPALKEFHTLGSAWQPRSLGMPSATALQQKAFASVLRLEHLDIRAEGSGSTTHFIAYSLGKLDFSALTRLSLWWFTAEDISYIGRLIVAAPSLLQLDLKLNNVLFDDEEDEPSPEAVCPKLNLRQCEHLRDVHLFVPTDDDTGSLAYFVPYWDVANAILAELPHSVCSISLTIESIVHPDDLEEVLSYTQWDKQLHTYQGLPNLKSVTFSGGIKGQTVRFPLEPRISRLIEESLSALSRGILRFL